MHMTHNEPCGGSSEVTHSELYSDANLFIRHLSHVVDEHELRRLFSPYGEILSAAVMRNIHTGENLGTAFVRYATTEQARAALKDFHGRFLYGRTISVYWARKQHDDAPVGEARRKIFKLFVRNIPLDVTAEDLARLFAYFGPVGNVTLHKDTASTGDKRLERRIAFVEYLHEGVAEKAAETIHNTRPFPSCRRIPLMVKLAEDLPSRSRRQTAALVDSFKRAFSGNAVRPHWCQHGTDINAPPPPPPPPTAPAPAPAVHYQPQPHGYFPCPGSMSPTWSFPPHFSSGSQSPALPRNLSYFECFNYTHSFQHFSPSVSTVTTPTKSAAAYHELSQQRLLAQKMPSWHAVDVPSQQTLQGPRTVPFGYPERNSCLACSIYASQRMGATSSPSSHCSRHVEDAPTPALLQAPQTASSDSCYSFSSFRGASNDGDSSGWDTATTMETDDGRKLGTRYTHNPYGRHLHDLILGPVAPLQVM